MHVALAKRPKNQFKLVQQSKYQGLRAYCLNIYTVKTKGGWIKADDINGISKVYSVPEDWVKER